MNTVTRKTGNPFEGVVGVRIKGPPVTSEADHFMTCPICGQAFDRRDLGQVVHHMPDEHEPLPPDA
jgi:5-methylcytosine-specific restriction endonuclease McrA